MIIQLEIPSAFENDYTKDRFDEFFQRVIADIDYTGACGNYEVETAQMMADAFKKSKAN
jgi:hypothetical protein